MGAAVMLDARMVTVLAAETNALKIRPAVGAAGRAMMTSSPTAAPVTVIVKSACSAAAQADLTIAVVGAAVGDEVIMALPAAPTAGLIFNAFVSATDVVTIRASNITAAPIDAAAATYGVIVIAA